MRIFSADQGRITYAHDTDDGIVLETKQDVSHIIESNKRQYNDSDGKYDPVITKVASLPLTVVDDLNRKGIMQGFKIIDDKAFRAFLNHPDNRFFKTHPGKI